MPVSPKTPSAIDQRLGAQLRARRLALGISQTELANKLGVTFQQVQKYENGMNRIPSGRMPVIAEMLEIRIADLYEGTEERSNSPNALGLQTFLADKSAVRLIAAWPNLPAAVRAAIAKLAQTYVDGAAVDEAENEAPAKRRVGAR